MTTRNVAASDTFEQFRVEFNELANDVVTILEPQTVKLPDRGSGDIGLLAVGDGSDLQIFHDGTNTRIQNTSAIVNTSELQIRNNGLMRLGGTSFVIGNVGGLETMIDATENGAVQLYHDNSVKIATTSTGISVTGNIQTSGNITNGSVNLTFPTVGGAISTEGFSIALATALG